MTILGAMTTPETPPKLTHAAPAEQAREQAAMYDSLFANQILHLGGNDTLTIPPHPDFGLLDDDITDEYNELVYARDTLYEREQTVYVPEQRIKDVNTGNETGVVLPPTEVQGELKTPYRWAEDGIFNGVEHTKGQLVKPAYSVQVVKAVLGEGDYKRLRDAKRSSADVWRVWSTQALEARTRQFRGPEADGSAVAVASVPEADSQ
jgi:hypothetical protein